MNKMKVLVFPGSTEIGLEIWRALKDCKDIILYSAASVYGHASYVFRNHFIVPDIHLDGWIDSLNKVISEHKIDYIFPAYDDVIVALAQNAHKLSAEIISSPIATCLTTRSKTQTYEKLNELIPTPHLYRDISEVTVFPVFVKPDKGQGSQGVHKVDDLSTLRVLLSNNPDLIVLEYLSGKEYTVDCLTDRRKGLVFCRGRERLRIKSGISMNSKSVDKKNNRIFCEYANIISSKLEFHGAWFFQIKQDASGNFKLLEVAPRVSGTMATHRVLGVNFPLLSIYEKKGIGFEIMINELQLEIDRSLVNRYKCDIEYDKVYVDLDDTIVVNNQVNTLLICFLYQAINKGCKIILITKNIDDLESVLNKWRLSSIFDEVIWIKKVDSKADFISPERAIFIDDSFSERKAVFDEHKIPTFDCNMIELLIDDRV